MENKYQMTREENLFLVKRNIIDYIWKDANLEGISVTYPDTEAIYEGMSVQGYKVQDIIAINNLKHSWQFLLDTLDYPMDYNYFCKLNQMVGENHLITNAGYIRQFPVRIGGTAWQPDIPVEAEIREEIQQIMEIKNPTERGITLMLYGMRKQMFLDGNKRTSMLAANQILISSGCGVIAVPVERKNEFLNMLVKFYETNNAKEIERFIFNFCIDGMQFQKQEKKEIQLSRKGLIINDLKKAGFVPTDSLIKNILELEKSKEQEFSVSKLQVIWKEKKELSADQRLVDIVTELKEQEVKKRVQGLEIE